MVDSQSHVALKKEEWLQWENHRNSHFFAKIWIEKVIKYRTCLILLGPGLFRSIPWVPRCWVPPSPTTYPLLYPAAQIICCSFKISAFESVLPECRIVPWQTPSWPERPVVHSRYSPAEAGRDTHPPHWSPYRWTLGGSTGQSSLHTHTHTDTDDTHSQQINSQYTKIVQFIVKVDLQFLHSAETIRYERKGHHILCKLNDSLHSQSPTSL